MMRVNDCEKLSGLLPEVLNGGDGRVVQRRIVQLFKAQTQWTKIRRAVSAVTCTAVMGIMCSISFAIGIQPVTTMSAQTAVQDVGTPAKIPTFDTVSIRPYGGPMPPTQAWDLRPDGYHGHAIPLFAIIITAYPPSQGYTDRFTPDELTDIPEWMNTQFYDIELRVAATDMPAWKQPAIQQAMLRAMLADRIKLTAHYDHKPGQVFELQIAKGGAKLKPTSAPDFASLHQSDPRADLAQNGSISTRGSSGEVLMYNAPMTQLCRDLRHMAGHPILDKTGLTARYDMSFRLDPPGGWPQPHDLADTPFFVVEQLGLKLVHVKAPVETLAIDHAEHPSAN